MPTYQQFNLPDAGEGLTEADIVQWHVAVGDTVAINQPLLEIETAKSLVELPCPYAGVVTQILVPAGTTAAVGDPIIIIDTAPGDDGSAQGPESSETAEAAGRGGAQAGGGGEAATARDGAGHRDGSAAITAAGQVSPSTGALPAGESAAAGGGSADAGDSDGASGAVLVGYGVAEETSARRVAPAGAGPAGVPGRVLAKPPVRKLALELGIDLAGVIPTGPGGIVTRDDVLAHQQAAQARELATYPTDDHPWLADGKVSPDGRQTRVPVRSVRRRTAEAMVTSAFSAPHVTVFHTVDVTKAMRLVARLRENKEFSDVRVTPLLIAARALLLAVDRHPEINASWDAAAQEIVYKHYVNLGIAAATPRGLVVPNIKDAHAKSLHALAVALGELTATARAGKTSVRDMSDGTITITNVGVFGIDTGTPILNPGEAAILAFGAIREQPWVHKGKIRVRQVTQLALSFDHRLVDGELGARVLADVATVLEEPAHGLVWA